MAESNSAAAPAVNTPIESGHFDEKETKAEAPPKKEAPVEEEEEDEDIVRKT